MNGADLFMGGLSLCLGAALLLAGALNWSLAFQSKRTQWLEARWGRGRARAIFVTLGAILIALGVAVATGFAPNAERKFTGVRGQESGVRNQESALTPDSRLPTPDSCPPTPDS